MLLLANWSMEMFLNVITDAPSRSRIPSKKPHSTWLTTFTRVRTGDPTETSDWDTFFVPNGACLVARVEEHNYLSESCVQAFNQICRV